MRRLRSPPRDEGQRLARKGCNEIAPSVWGDLVVAVRERCGAAGLYAYDGRTRQRVGLRSDARCEQGP